MHLTQTTLSCNDLYFFHSQAAQAADSGNDGGCSSCEYQKYTTGLIRSKAGLKHGFVEVKMQIPDASVVGNIWLQGKEI